MNENKVTNILVDDIIPNRFQPRLRFEEKDLIELSESIKLHGIIQPIVVRKINDKYEIIAGERRYKASQIAGLKEVPTIIIEADDNKSAELAVIENLQRKDLTAIEEAKSFKKLLDRGYTTQEELAKRMGVSQSAISNKLRLLNLPEEVQNALLESRISERHARSLLSLKSPSQQITMLDKIINNRLTVKQTDKEIAEMLGNISKDEIVEDLSIETKPIENISNFINEETEEPEKIDVFDDNEEGEIMDNIEEENVVEEPIESSAFNINDLLKSDIPEEENNEILEDTSKNIIETVIDEPIEQIDNFGINPFQEDSMTNAGIDNSLDYNALSKKSTKLKNRDLISVITDVRDATKKIEAAGYDVNAEEFDFDDMYQIVIKIQK